jgi:lipoprotein-anchoring transpeptidase ErfK/SrfK
MAHRFELPFTPGSRSVLVAAWALIAVGVTLRILGVGEGADGDLDDKIEDAVEVADSAETASEAVTERPDEAPDRLAFDRRDEPGAVLDDPAHWYRAGIVLAPTSLVATVIDEAATGILGTSNGVASTAEPGPGPVQHWFPSPTQFGGDRTFLVLDADSNPDYVKVALPVMPNGQEGWIPRNRVELTEVSHRALVDLTRATLTVWAGDEIIVQTEAVVGAPDTPTARGRFYVRDIVAQDDPTAMFGPHVLVLSGFSDVLDTFEGKLPALAIHGTDRPDQVGSRLSAGCVRIPNELIDLLVGQVPLGTPVTIVA